MDLRHYLNNYIAPEKLNGLNYIFTPSDDGLFFVYLYVEKLFNSDYYLELKVDGSCKILSARRVNIYFDKHKSELKHFKGEAEDVAENILKSVICSEPNGTIDPLLEKYNKEQEDARKAEEIRKSKLIPIPDNINDTDGVLNYFLNCLKAKQQPELFIPEFLLAYRLTKKAKIDTRAYIDSFLDVLVNYGDPDSLWFCLAEHIVVMAIDCENCDRFTKKLLKIKNMAEDSCPGSLTIESQHKYHIIETLYDL